MKKFTLILFTIVALNSFGQTYPGNQKTGFGGVVGTGSLEIANTHGTITFTLTKGVADFNDCAVIFIDSKSGGATSTSGFTDQGDDLRKAISGVNGGDRAILNFATGFTPDYAIAFNVGENGGGGFGGIWDLSDPNNFPYVTSAELVPENNRSSATFTVKATKENLGIPSQGTSFKFLVTYISRTAYRSNEFIGDAGPTDNPGFSPYTSTTFSTYSSATLPVSFNNFSASKVGEKINLRWQTEQENNILRYDILRSRDGQSFETVGSKAASGSSLKQVYNFDDVAPLSGNNFYKIAIIGENGNIQYSNVALIKMVNGSFKAYIVASNRILKVNWNSDNRKVFNLMMTNQAGQVVYKTKLASLEGMNTYSFDLNKSLPIGIYSILLTDGNEKESQLLMVK